MTSGDTHKRIKRLLHIVLEIKTQPQQTVEQLYTELGVSKTQFYKDKTELAELGFEFFYDRRRQRFIIEKDPHLPVEFLTLSERLSLVLAFRQISAAGDHILTYEGFKAVQKIAADLPRQVRESLFEGIVLKEGFGCESDILEKLQKAAAENWHVRILYQRPEQDSPGAEEVDPYHIFFKRRALYMEGFSHTQNAIRMYRMNRIRQADLMYQGFGVKHGYHFGARYKNAFSAFPGETTQHVVVRFHRRIKPYIEESLWHHSQKTSAEADGSLRFEADIAEPREVMWWAFFWGDGAEILEPVWLREEARRITRKMSDIYLEKEKVS